MSGAQREMRSDELVEAMENLHQYPRLIAERAYAEGLAAATPAPLTLTRGLFDDLGEVLAAAVYETDNERYICRMCDSDVTTAPHSDDCEVKHLREWTFAANKAATPAPLPCNHDWQPWLANTSQCSCCGARRDDLAATPAPLDADCGDECPTSGLPDTGYDRGYRDALPATPAPLDVDDGHHTPDTLCPICLYVQEHLSAAGVTFATPAPLDVLREAAEQYREAVRRRDPEAMQHIANRIVYRLILAQPKEADRG